MPKIKFSLSTQILLGLGAGVLAGLFFGDLAGGLSVLGSAYVKILEMTVLPYIVISLIMRIGKLDLAEIKRFGANGGKILLMLLSLGLVIYYLFALALPNLITASFFSATLVEQREATNVLETYIPANPFKSLADGTIPAVVVFCALLGAALSQLPNKQVILDSLQVLSQAVSDMTNLCSRLAPLGVFAIVASVIGTLSFEQMTRFQFYVICLYLANLAIFLILPGLASCVTSFAYRELFDTARDASILALTTGNGFIVLPMIAENVKRLFRRYPALEHNDEWIDSIIPLAFVFPGIPSLIPIFFVLFTTWFYGTPINLVQNIELVAMGLSSSFGSSTATVIFLLHQLHLPADALGLFLIGSQLTRFGIAALGIMYTTIFTIIFASALGQRFRINRRKLVTTLAVTGIALTICIGVTRWGLGLLTENSYQGQSILFQMRLQDTVPAQVLPDEPRSSVANPSTSQTNVLARIHQRGVLRVGVDIPALPFTFYNLDQELVGYDIARAHSLAQILGCRLEFVPLHPATLAQDLNAGVFDIAMARIAIQPDKIQALSFSNPYLTLHVGLVVKDYRAEEFKTLDAIRQMKTLRLAVPEGAQDLAKIKTLLPQAQIILVQHADDFFALDDVDALWTTAEEGSTWSLLYPDYGVAVPTPMIGAEVLGYAIAKDNPDFIDVLNLWLTLSKENGSAQKLYDYWILGKQTTRTYHWSIIRDVLHWVP